MGVDFEEKLLSAIEKQTEALQRIFYTLKDIEMSADISINGMERLLCHFCGKDSDTIKEFNDITFDFPKKEKETE